MKQDIVSKQQKYKVLNQFFVIYLVLTSKFNKIEMGLLWIFFFV